MAPRVAFLHSTLQIILHLMEVGRLGVRWGIEPPALIKLEMELEEELPEPEPEPTPEPTPEPEKPKKGVSFLDEQVFNQYNLIS